MHVLALGFLQVSGQTSPTPCIIADILSSSRLPLRCRVSIGVHGLTLKTSIRLQAGSTWYPLFWTAPRVDAAAGPTRPDDAERHETPGPSIFVCDRVHARGIPVNGRRTGFFPSCRA